MLAKVQGQWCAGSRFKSGPPLGFRDSQTLHRGQGGERLKEEGVSYTRQSGLEEGGHLRVGADRASELSLVSENPPSLALPWPPQLSLLSPQALCTLQGSWAPEGPPKAVLCQDNFCF